MYDAELDFAKTLAHESGRIMLQMFGKAQTSWKSDNTPVTEADIAINELVISKVKAAFPKDGILGEEASYMPERPRKWVVDPIDGTQPYDAGMPLSTFCLGLVVDSTPVLGVVYDPFQDILYSGRTGQGAFANNERISVSSSGNLDSEYCFTSSRMNGLSSGTANDILANAGMKVFNIRSIAYSLMNLACGKSVAVIGGKSHPWDLAAAMVILNEAGGRMTDFEGSALSYDYSENGFLATNGIIHSQIVELLHSR